MIFFVTAISAGCIYFIIRGLRSRHDYRSTLTALYFTTVPLLGMMIGDAFVEVRSTSFGEDSLVVDGAGSGPLVIGILVGFIVALAMYPFIKDKQRSPNQAL